MRRGSLFLWDIRFQAKYGFYFLYAALTVIYGVVLFAVPEGWREKTAAILIFSDPASMGLFFMGAIVLLEKKPAYTLRVCGFSCPGGGIHCRQSRLAVCHFLCCRRCFGNGRRCG